jgi:hypothetical protein
LDSSLTVAIIVVDMAIVAKRRRREKGRIMIMSSVLFRVLGV